MLRATGVHHITSTTVGEVSGMYVRIRKVGVVWCKVLSVLWNRPLVAERGVGIVESAEIRTVECVWVIMVTYLHCHSPALPPTNEMQPLPGYLLQHFSSRTARKPDLKTLPASLAPERTTRGNLEKPVLISNGSFQIRICTSRMQFNKTIPR
jgi:hypothetical protein